MCADEFEHAYPLQCRDHDRGGETLALWRTTPFQDIDIDAIREIRRVLAGSLTIAHRRWPAARRGDAAAAIRVTLDLTRGPTPGATQVDLALSSVLVAAWQGDPAARIVLAHVLRARRALDAAASRRRALPQVRTRIPVRPSGDASVTHAERQ